MFCIRGLFILVFCLGAELDAQVLLSRRNMFGPGLGYGLSGGKENLLKPITNTQQLGASVSFAFGYYRNIYDKFWIGTSPGFQQFKWRFQTKSVASPGYQPTATYGIVSNCITAPLEMLQYFSSNQGRGFLSVGFSPGIVTRKAQQRKQDVSSDSIGITTLLQTNSYRHFSPGYKIALGFEFETFDDMYARFSVGLHTQYYKRSGQKADFATGVFLTAQYFWVR